MFRFTIRELVLLTVIVAMALAWCSDHARLAQAWQDSESEGKQAQWAATVLAREMWTDPETDRIILDMRPTQIRVRRHLTSGQSENTYYFPHLPDKQPFFVERS
jgi:hypothetical protein